MAFAFFLLLLVFFVLMVLIEFKKMRAIVAKNEAFESLAYESVKDLKCLSECFEKLVSVYSEKQ